MSFPDRCVRLFIYRCDFSVFFFGVSFINFIFAQSDNCMCSCIPSAPFPSSEEHIRSVFCYTGTSPFLVVMRPIMLACFVHPYVSGCRDAFSNVNHSDVESSRHHVCPDVRWVVCLSSRVTVSHFSPDYDKSMWYQRLWQL